MSTKRVSEEDAPDAVRTQIATQLRIDSWRLAQIPADGLYRLRDQLAIDDLTGVLRRQAGLAALTREVERARRSADRRLVVAFVDVDRLKTINDTLGHAAGDEVLHILAGILKRRLRRQDLVFRYGGDEFVCVLPNASIGSAVALMVDARRYLSEHGTLGFTVGFAELGDGDDVKRLLERADECLYAAKRRRHHDRWGSTLIGSSRSSSGTYELRGALARLSERRLDADAS